MTWRCRGCDTYNAADVAACDVCGTMPPAADRAAPGPNLGFAAPGHRGIPLLATPALGSGKPPVIELVKVDDDYVTAGSLVTLSWRTRDASMVEIADFGAQALSGSIAVAVDSTTTFTVRASNPHGASVAASPVVRVVAPRFELVDVPRYPAITFDFACPLAEEAGSLPDAGADHAPTPPSRLAPYFVAAPPEARKDEVARWPAPRLAGLFKNVGALRPLLNERGRPWAKHTS